MIPLNIHFVAIGGTGMAPLACLLKNLGHRVSGSDGPLYPPMSTLLAEAGIDVLEGYSAEHMRPGLDLIVIGNAIRRDNPEAVAAEESGVEILSMPQALGRYLLADRRPLVVAGTHGKTTTSSIAAFVYSKLGQDPGFLIGGVPLDLPGSFAVGEGRRFVIEGDEYNAAYFDRGPKFWHYRAQTLILTHAEYDHADLYPSPASFREAFAELIRRLPADGLLVACRDQPEVMALCGGAPCDVVTYGFAAGADVRIVDLEADEAGTRFNLQSRDGVTRPVELSLWGRHNVSNATAVWCCAKADNLGEGHIATALKAFRGVRRRLELLGYAEDVAVIDDFAHHPTEVAASVRGLKERFPRRRLVVVYEPRSLTAGQAFLYDDYLRAFAEIDRLFLAPIFYRERFEQDQLIDRGALCTELRTRGVVATDCATVEETFDLALADLRQGDVVATMSSGSFDSMPLRLLESLRSSDPRIGSA